MRKSLNFDYKSYLNIFLIVLIILTLGSYISCSENKTEDNFKINNKEEIEETEETEEIEEIEETEETEEKNNKKNKKNKERFLDWSLYNPPIVNGYTPSWWNKIRKASVNNIDNIYNPFGYSSRKNNFYSQGWYPNMNLPAQVIGCGGRRMPCLGGTQETVPVINSPIDISDNNIAPVNLLPHSMDIDRIGVVRQVGVLYKIYGTLNEIYPLYGVKRYRNSDTWDYSTKVGKEGNFVHVKVLTKRVNNNELQTNDEIRIDGNSARFRVTMYDKDFPQYNPLFRN